MISRRIAIPISSKDVAKQTFGANFIKMAEDIMRHKTYLTRHFGIMKIGQSRFNNSPQNAELRIISDSISFSFIIMEYVKQYDDSFDITKSPFLTLLTKFGGLFKNSCLPEFSAKTIISAIAKRAYPDTLKPKLG